MGTERYLGGVALGTRWDGLLSRGLGEGRHEIEELCDSHRRPGVWSGAVSAMCVQALHVGANGSNTVGVFVRAPVGVDVSTPLSVTPGMWISIGALVARSKLVCLHHSPCSPSCHPWSPQKLITVLLE